MSDLITISRLRAYRTCPRYHHLSYDLRLEPIEAGPSVTDFGTAGHAGLEAWLESLRDGLDADDALQNALDAGTLKAQDLGLDAYEIERLRAALEGYHARWLDAPLEIVEVEVEFRSPLRHPETGTPHPRYQQGGKIDGIVRDTRDGRLLLMEHKFTTQDVSPGSIYWQRLRLDGQVSIYMDGAAEIGHEIDGCLYDVIAVPAVKPHRATPEASRRYTLGKGCKPCGGKARGQRGNGCAACGLTGWEDPPRLYADQREADETVEEYGERVRALIAEAPDRCYGRGTVVRLPGELEEARWDVWATAEQIRAAEEMGHHPRNADACPRMYGRTCSFLAACCGEAEIDDPYRYRVRASAHPELQQLERGAP